MRGGMSLNRIPGYAEAVAKARSKQNAQRDNAWKNIPCMVWGLPVRIMTVQDYIILEHYGSPFVFRNLPTDADVAFFLWALSPECLKWNSRKYFPFLRSLAAWRFSRKIVKRLKQKPEQFEEVVKSIFDYVENIFIDAPPSVQKSNSSGVSYLASWFDMMQSEYSFDMREIWNMPLPQLFQRILSIYHRKGIKVPVFNSIEDKVKQWVQDGISNRKFTMEDLAEGKVKFGEN
jgi:hypothetical protein